MWRNNDPMKCEAVATSTVLYSRRDRDEAPMSLGTTEVENGNKGCAKGMKRQDGAGTSSPRRGLADARGGYATEAKARGLSFTCLNNAGTRNSRVHTNGKGLWARSPYNPCWSLIVTVPHESIIPVTVKVCDPSLFQT